MGGISLNYTNEPGAIAVVGVIQNKHTGFSTTNNSQEGLALSGALALTCSRLKKIHSYGKRDRPGGFICNLHLKSLANAGG